MLSGVHGDGRSQTYSSVGCSWGSMSFNGNPLGPGQFHGLGRPPTAASERLTNECNVPPGGCTLGALPGERRPAQPHSHAPAAASAGYSAAPQLTRAWGGPNVSNKTVPAHPTGPHRTQVQPSLPFASRPCRLKRPAQDGQDARTTRPRMATRCIVQEMKKLHEQGQADIRLVYTGHEAEDSGVLFGNACNLPISMAGRAYAALNNDLPLVRSLGVCFEGGAPSTRSPLMIQLATASVVVVEIVPSSKGLSPECHRLLGDATVLKYIYEKDVARLQAVVPSLERSTCVLLCQRIPGEPADMAAAMNIAIPHASQEAWVQPHLDTAYPTASAATTGGQLLDANGFGWFAAAGAFFTHQLGSMSEDLMPMERTHMEMPNTPSRRRTLPVRLVMSDSDDQNSDSSPGGGDEDDGCSSTLFGTLPPLPEGGVRGREYHCPLSKTHHAWQKDHLSVGDRNWLHNPSEPQYCKHNKKFKGFLAMQQHAMAMPDSAHKQLSVYLATIADPKFTNTPWPAMQPSNAPPESPHSEPQVTGPGLVQVPSNQDLESTCLSFVERPASDIAASLRAPAAPNICVTAGNMESTAPSMDMDEEALVFHGHLATLAVGRRARYACWHPRLLPEVDHLFDEGKGILFTPVKVGFLHWVLCVADFRSMEFRCYNTCTDCRRISVWDLASYRSGLAAKYPGTTAWATKFPAVEQRPGLKDSGLYTAILVKAIIRGQALSSCLTDLGDPILARRVLCWEMAHRQIVGCSALHHEEPQRQPSEFERRIAEQAASERAPAPPEVVPVQTGPLGPGVCQVAMDWEFDSGVAAVSTQLPKRVGKLGHDTRGRGATMEEVVRASSKAEESLSLFAPDVQDPNPTETIASALASLERAVALAEGRARTTAALCLAAQELRGQAEHQLSESRARLDAAKAWAAASHGRYVTAEAQLAAARAPTPDMAHARQAALTAADAKGASHTAKKTIKKRYPDLDANLAGKLDKFGTLSSMLDLYESLTATEFAKLNLPDQNKALISALMAQTESTHDGSSHAVHRQFSHVVLVLGGYWCLRKHVSPTTLQTLACQASTARSAWEQAAARVPIEEASVQACVHGVQCASQALEQATAESFEAFETKVRAEAALRQAQPQVNAPVGLASCPWVPGVTPHSGPRPSRSPKGGWLEGMPVLVDSSSSMSGCHSQLVACCPSSKAWSVRHYDGSVTRHGESSLRLVHGYRQAKGVQCPYVGAHDSVSNLGPEPRHLLGWALQVRLCTQTFVSHVCTRPGNPGETFMELGPNYLGCLLPHLEHLPEIGNFVDIGAGTGLQLLVAAATHGFSLCVGFERNPQLVARYQAWAAALVDCDSRVWSPIVGRIRLEVCDVQHSPSLGTALKGASLVLCWNLRFEHAVNEVVFQAAKESMGTGLAAYMMLAVGLQSDLPHMSAVELPPELGYPGNPGVLRCPHICRPGVRYCMNTGSGQVAGGMCLWTTICHDHGSLETSTRRHAGALHVCFMVTALAGRKSMRSVHRK